MSEDETHPGVMTNEVQEAFIQHIEQGSSTIKLLAVITVVVTGFLTLSYASQLILLPYVLHITSQTVNLLDPGLMATEVVLLAIVLLWLYVGVRDLIFVSRLSKQIEEIRKLQRQIEDRISA
jgi:hypothetical protein